MRLTKERLEELANDDNEIVAKASQIVLKNEYQSDSEDSK